MEKAIEFKHVTKTYKLYKSDREKFKGIFFKNVKAKEKNAIDDVSFVVEKGEAVALFGRNGAGKSTLLKMITQVVFPTKGEICVNGRVSALLELTAGFDTEFTGRENIYLRGQLMGIPQDEMRKLEREIVDFAELGNYIDQPVRTYSSGMKARLGFAINANIEPDILIVDEALSVGDKAFRLKCNAKINEIVESGVTFLFVTHSVNVAKDFCRRGIVMKRGKIILDGTVEEAAEFYEKLVADDVAKKKRIWEEKKKEKVFQ